jgi:phosphoribosylformylglycinamidine synthase subunit PurS
MYKAQITLKSGILDIAGNTVTEALRHLGFTEVSNVRIGKILEYNADSLEEARAIAESQTNEVMEDFYVEGDPKTGGLFGEDEDNDIQ